MFKKDNSLLVNLTCISILLFLLFYILKVWANLIIPFIIALLFSFAIIWLSNYYKKFKIPSFISFLLSVLTYIFIFWMIWEMIWTNIEELRKSLPLYQNAIIELYNKYAVLLWDYAPESIPELLQKINLQKIFTVTVWAFTSIFSRMWLIIFFLIFILLENRFLNRKLYLMISYNPNNAVILETLDKIKNDVKSYFVVKTIISTITWVLFYFISLAFWLDFAVFWGFLAFILNFIPNLGSIIAVFLPTILSLVQPWFLPYDTLFMASLFILTEVMCWNIIEPQFMWNKLNLSPLVIIISLAFWWIIWWIIWMLLSVPIMVIINIMLAKIPATKSLAIFLSEKWDLQVESEDVVKNRKHLIKSLKQKFEVMKKK
jgi:predicted PurR-regulated permease PerM